MTNVILAYETLCWQGGRLSWTGATLSLIPQRQLHLYHSLQVHCKTKACLRIRLCRRSRTCITQGQQQAAMFTRSTHGCGISAGPRLKLEGFWLPKQKGSADSPGLKYLGALGRHERPARWQLKRHNKHIPGTFSAHARHVLGIYIPHTFSE
jgi:hypothetical protein